MRRFWENPSSEVARNLVRHGCVGNTFVMLGTLRAFLGLVQETVPGLYRAFEPMICGESTDDGALASGRLEPGRRWVERPWRSTTPDRNAVETRDSKPLATDLGTGNGNCPNLQPVEFTW